MILHLYLHTPGSNQLQSGARVSNNPTPGVIFIEVTSILIQ